MQRAGDRHRGRRWTTTSTALGVATALLVSACSPGEEASHPEGWVSEEIADERVGTFAMAHPDAAAVWRAGGATDEIAEATDGSDWAGFWLPLLDDATSATSNVRAVAADASSLPGTVVSWQVNVNDADPALQVTEPEELARVLRERFEAQGLEVVDAGTEPWRDRRIAVVAFRVPAEVFGGEDRLVRQWYIPRRAPEAMWSFSCDAPDDAAAVDELCRSGLDGFRIDPHPDA